MLVSKSKVTNSVLKSEKKSLFRFLSLYLGIVTIIISLLSFYYYKTQEEIMLSNQRANLEQYAYREIKRLKELHNSFDNKHNIYPRDKHFKSAIYDLEYVKIFSDMEEDIDIIFKEGIYQNGSYIYLVKMLTTYYLGAKYLIVEVKDDTLWKTNVVRNISIYGILFFIISAILGVFLANMFVKPMRNSILLLDRFIKDTTHELNTPLSAILANIEMIDTSSMDKKNISKINRINIATKTVSILYKDLTYLTLEQDRDRLDENIDLKSLIEDRVEYFMAIMESKNISCKLYLNESSLYIDKKKITRVIDNLISNAIKYNLRNGVIEIELKDKRLSVKDSGIGIKEEEIPFIFDRYLRFNDSEGGFGVGLSIVKSILDEYNIKIDVISSEQKGTTMVLLW